MKKKRQEKILEIIKSGQIETQDDLLILLCKAGFDVTQATVSRDVKELGLIKVSVSGGKYCYSQNQVLEMDMSNRVYQTVFDYVKEIRSANNLIVIKCLPGTAQAVCASIDTMEYKSVLGTIAGDDTIFAAAESNDSAEFLVREFSKILSRKQ